MSCAFGIPDCETTHRLRIEKLPHSRSGEFAPIAGAFDAAKGKPRIACDHRIDEDRAALQLRERRCCSAGSRVHTEALSPKGVSFASSIASSRFATRKSIATGPKSSSRYTAQLRGTSTSTVGSK